ncbi:hypothetical protein SCORR_v1c04670 [Spiroplasma corruscae]|uniref:Uncharacterized protein n=1 Tax=Spiroplasma corruscae TaxID=216934 RepID=A0A222EP04_9MOLU|nr:hypothetical protein [Spiroplasma corruscae]ASP28239.1 hypothetical protein SCORR_v1c04670 [Spiroplasma corruscae]
MPRTLQPTQIVTYKKKITSKNTDTNTSFWGDFLKIFFIQILAIAVGSLTAGIGTAAVEALGFSQLGIAVTSSIIQTSINFGVNELYDYATDNLSVENTLMNLLFGISDVGKFGRALKYDKLLKLVNEHELLSSLNITNKVKNFYQIKKFLTLKNIILKDKRVLSFATKITDIEILQSIMAISTAEMKKSIKQFSEKEIQALLDIQKTLYKIEPGLLVDIKKMNIKKYDAYFKKSSGTSIEEFLKMNDLEAIEVIKKLQGTNLGNSTLAQLNILRVKSGFQKNIIDQLKNYKTKVKGAIKKINPFTYIQKAVNKMLEPFTNVMSKIASKVNKYLPNLSKLSKHLVKNNNLIPCQPNSFLLGFSFTPTGISGEGVLEIFKKPYLWKKQPGRVSYYRKVTVFTNLQIVEAFALSNNQNKFYKDNWELGRGFNQGNDKLFKILSPGLKKVFINFNKLVRKVTTIKTILKAGVLSSFKNYSSKKLNSIYRSTLRKLIESPFKRITGIGLFSSSISDLILDSTWNSKKAFNNTVGKTIRKRAKHVGSILGG